jgi:hypothetical protein
MAQQAIGMIETRGLVALVEGTEGGEGSRPGRARAAEDRLR